MDFSLYLWPIFDLVETSKLISCFKNSASLLKSSSAGGGSSDSQFGPGHAFRPGPGPGPPGPEPGPGPGPGPGPDCLFFLPLPPFPPGPGSGQDWGLGILGPAAPGAQISLNVSSSLHPNSAIDSFTRFVIFRASVMIFKGGTCSSSIVIHRKQMSIFLSSANVLPSLQLLTKLFYFALIGLRV